MNKAEILNKYELITRQYNSSNIEILEKSEETKLFYDTLLLNNIIEVNKFGKINKLNKNKIYVGTLQKKANFGFVIIPNKEDFYVQNVDNYFDGDIVLIVERKDRGRNSAGEILSLINREDLYYTAKMGENNNVILMDKFPIDKKIEIQGIDLEQIKEGVVFSIYIKEIKPKKVIAKLHNIIADSNDPDLKMKLILDKYGINVDFSQKSIAELDNIPSQITQEQIVNKKRIDLREQVFFTIDGNDSKDLDDAVSLIKEGDKFRLFVAIADVSEYIKEGTQLDIDAQERATSVYFIDRVIPMLPKPISNGICSLHANVDRLTLTCEMLINQEGKVEEHKIYESVINSNYRLTYEEVNEILINKNKEMIAKYQDIYSIILEMNKLREILNKKRLKRGAFNLEDSEAKFKFNTVGEIIDIETRDRQDAEKIIEELMIIANETVTEYVAQKNYPFIYRIHGKPNPKKLTELKNLLMILKINIPLDEEKINPQVFKEILDAIEEDTFKRIISKLIVRSMKKAVYSTENIGHFGLATDYYTHFTSPIRRYPDLEVHRLLKKYIYQEEGDLTPSIEELKAIAEHSSEKEVSSIKAEQEIEDSAKAQYMQQFIGKEFIGTISGIEDYGMFVELENTIRGLVRFNDLKNFEKASHYKIEFKEEEPLTFGDEIKVTLVAVNLERGLVDFVPTDYKTFTQKEKDKQRIKRNKEALAKREERNKKRIKSKHRGKDNETKNSKNKYYKKKTKGKGKTDKKKEGKKEFKKDKNSKSKFRKDKKFKNNKSSKNK